MKIYGNFSYLRFEICKKILDIKNFLENLGILFKTLKHPITNQSARMMYLLWGWVFCAIRCFEYM